MNDYTNHQEYRQALRYLANGALQAGIGLGLAPVSMLPAETQQHFKAASHEFICGLAKLAQGFANDMNLDKKAE